MTIQFEWDSDKAASNRKKHGVSFELATKVFDDPYAFFSQDRVVDGEERWQCIGHVGLYTLVLVAYTYRGLEDGDEIVRIISARLATTHERRRYERECGSS